LFLIFINDIDKGIVSKLLKFADDTKLVGTVCTEVKLEQLRTDLKLLYSWSIDWQMIFNTDKCKVVHFGYFGYNNTAADYSLGDVNIQSVKEEKDLGIIIHQTLKSSQQCVAAANSANRTLGMINMTFVNKHSNIMLRLSHGHTVVTRSHGSVTSVVRATRQVNGRRQIYPSHHTHTP